MHHNCGVVIICIINFVWLYPPLRLVTGISSDDLSSDTSIEHDSPTNLAIRHILVPKSGVWHETSIMTPPFSSTFQGITGESPEEYIEEMESYVARMTYITSTDWKNHGLNKQRLYMAYVPYAAHTER